jgi:tetratricopeptide (TPR) repeat protein
MLLLRATTGEVVDTIYSDGSAGELTAVESEYSNANASFYSGNYSEAENLYEQIITGYGDSASSIEAYNKLYLLKKYENANAQGYDNLKQYYENKLSSIDDSTILLVVNNLRDLCIVSKEEYEQAISNFDETAQNNQGTDIALYNEINAYTTALLLDTTNSMGKGRLVKYKSSSITDYLKNVSSLLKTRGKKIENGENILIPKEYKLYQNYPNPFNPMTTIKYDIPKTARVTLKIYDILGREVRTLIDNEVKSPGSYRVMFNASSLASGVYIYRLQTDEYTNSKKMILIK